MPRKTAPAKAKAGTPKPRSKPAKPEPERRTPKKRTGRPPAHDWSSIRREYIRGDDDVTYAALAAKPNYPSIGGIERRAAAEDWTGLRQDFRRDVDLKLRELDVDLKAEVRKRHAGIGKGMTNLGAQSLKDLAAQLQGARASSTAAVREAARLLKAGADPDSLEVQEQLTKAAQVQANIRLDSMDVVRFIKYGTDLERKALGMEDLNINFRNISGPEDLDRLSEAELWRLAGRLPPDEDDDPEF